MGKTDDFVMNTFPVCEGTTAVCVDTAANTVDQPHRTVLAADEIFLRQTTGVAALAVRRKFLEQSAVSGTLTVCPGKEK